MADFKFILNGEEVNAPLDWENLEIDVKFPNDSIQPVLNISDATLVNRSAQLVMEWFNGGVDGSSGGAFENIPYQIQLANPDNNAVIFNGCISFDDFEFIENEQVKVKLIQNDALNSLNKKLEAITFLSLYNQGLIKNSDFVDIDYVEAKKQSLTEILIANIILFIMIKELLQSLSRATSLLADIGGESAGGVTGAAGAAVISSIKLALELVYVAALMVIIVDLGEKLINAFVPIVRTSKGIKSFTLLEKAASKLGYGFISPIPELAFETFLPSAVGTDEAITIGVPNESDTGYNALEFFEQAKNRYTAKYAIIGDDIHLRWEDDPFWVNQSTYILRDTDNNSFGINKDEFKSSIITTFRTDLADDWTIDDAEGRVYQTITDTTNFNNLKKKDVTGLLEINNSYALGSRKNELTDIENGLVPVAGAIDKLAIAFGRRTNFKSKILGKVGLLKVSSKAHSVAKLLYLKGSKLPFNHRDKYSATVLGRAYQSAKRFDVDNFKAQKKLFNNRRLGFGLNDFVNLLDNSYLTDENGNPGKVTSFKWRISKDEAIVNYYKREPYYKFFNTVEDEPS